MSLTVQEITGRLESIEKELADLQAPYSNAAEAWVRADREWELRMVRGKLSIKAETQTEKKDRALDALSVAEDGIYEKHVNAQAAFEGMRSEIKVLDTRAMIGMALMKSQRETGG